MRVIEPSVHVERFDPVALMRGIEKKGRLCYKSEPTSPTSYEQFLRKIIERGHESVLEHASISVRFVIDRGVSHELVRHRLAAISQESTRYVSSVTPTSTVIAPTAEAVSAAYTAGLSMKRIAEKTNGQLTEWQVWQILDECAVPKRNVGRRGLINESFFDSIDTPIKSYLLGFIFADGSIRRKAPQITLTQKPENQWFLLRIIRDFIQPEANSLTFQSTQLHSQLISKGIVPNKTYEFDESCADRLWSSIPDSLVPDFLRGLLDGDGHIRFFHQHNPGRTFSCKIGFCGPLCLLTKIQQWMQDNLQYTPTIRYEKETARLHSMVISNPSVGIALCKQMYANFVFPYGHPKTERVLSTLRIQPQIAQWGDPKYVMIRPFFFDGSRQLWDWGSTVDRAERCYRDLLESGVKPQEARSILPNSLKTELWFTANVREWRHIMKVRAHPAAHPQMQQVMYPLFFFLRTHLPVLFDDIPNVLSTCPAKHFAKVSWEDA